jgi:hypothetical protein
VFSLVLASNANLIGMALAKLDSGRGTKFTASLAALVVALSLFVLLRQVWKRPLPV